MNVVELKAEAVRLERKLSAKGYITPDVDLHIGFLGDELCLAITYRASEYGKSLNNFLYGKCVDGFDPMLEQAEAYIDSLQSIADAKRDEFIAAVGKLIDQGRDIGIEVDFLNPLTEMMTKLSSNIITKQEVLF